MPQIQRINRIKWKPTREFWMSISPLAKHWTVLVSPLHMRVCVCVSSDDVEPESHRLFWVRKILWMIMHAHCIKQSQWHQTIFIISISITCTLGHHQQPPESGVTLAQRNCLLLVVVIKRQTEMLRHEFIHRATIPSQSSQVISSQDSWGSCLFGRFPLTL